MNLPDYYREEEDARIWWETIQALPPCFIVIFPVDPWPEFDWPDADLLLKPKAQ